MPAVTGPPELFRSAPSQLANPRFHNFLGTSPCVYRRAVVHRDKGGVRRLRDLAFGYLTNLRSLPVRQLNAKNLEGSSEKTRGLSSL